MIRSRLGLKALVLSGLVLGLMAFGTSAAQAEKEAKWMVNGVTMTSDVLLPEVQVTEVENKTASLLLTLKSGTKVEFLCTSITLAENVKLLLEGSLSLGKAIFHGCITKLNGVISKNCEPFSLPGGVKTPGLIESEKATGLIVLHETGGVKEGIVQISPDVVGGPFATIRMGEFCSIGEEVKVTGKLFIKDCKGAVSFKTEAKTHLIESHSLTSLEALSVPATLDGSALAELAGATHKGLNWSGLPA